MPRRPALLALLLPLLACDEPAAGTVTMRAVEMRELGGVIVLTGTLAVAEVALQTANGAALEIDPQPQEPRRHELDEMPPSPPPNHAECGTCTCELATWICECTECAARAEPLL